MIKPLLILTGAVIVLARMYFTSSILTPILFAFFIAALLTPIHRWLKRRMSGGLALLLSIGVLALVTLFLVLLIGNSLTTLISDLASYQETLGQRKAELEAYAGEMGQTSAFQALLSALDPAIPPVILAFAQGGLGLALVIILLTIVINSLTENIVSPLVMGKGLSVSPTVVFLSFVFWMFILGGLGAFIAMPLTLGLILFMRNFKRDAWPGRDGGYPARGGKRSHWSAQASHGEIEPAIFVVYESSKLCFR